MSKEQFHRILAEPQLAAELDVDHWREIARQYPYSQAVQLVYTMGLRYQQEHLFDRQLGKTSILTSDRVVLFELFEEQEVPEQNSAVEETSSKVFTAEQTPVIEQSPEREENSRTPETEVDSQKEEGIENPEEHPSEDKTADKGSLAARIERLKEEHRRRKSGEQREERAETRTGEVDDPDKETLASEEKAPELTEPPQTIPKKLPEPEPVEEAGTGDALEKRIAEIRSRLARLKEELSGKEEASGRPAEATTGQEASDLETEQRAASEAQRPSGPERREEIANEEVNKQENEAAEADTDISTDNDGRSEDLDRELLRIEARAEVEKEAPVKTSSADRATDEDAQVKPTPEASEKNTSNSAAEKERYSFSDWLKTLRQGKREFKAEQSNTEPSETAASDSDMGFSEKMHLLDSFVEKLPDLKKRKPLMEAPPARPLRDKPQPEEEGGSLVTETLAKVYIRQKHYKKAMQAYEILKLKYPEKSSFFAGRISEIKELANSK